MATSAWDKYKLEMEMKRARWSMEIQADRSTKYSILPQQRYDLYGRKYVIWNVYAVDHTRYSRDKNYGTQVLMNTQCPFYSYEEAKEYAKEVFVDRKTVYFRGTPAHLIKGRQYKLTPPSSSTNKDKK